VRYVVNGTFWVNGFLFTRVDTADGADWVNGPIALVQNRQDAEFIASALNSRATASTDPSPTGAAKP
jgi:hypothetical protein